MVTLNDVDIELPFYSKANVMTKGNRKDEKVCTISLDRTHACAFITLNVIIFFNDN